jgi:diaphanous 1
MLSRIKLDLPEIRKALLDIDDEKLPVDDLKAIGRQLPTSEEVHISRARSMHRSNTALRQINRIGGFEDVRKLSKADQYFSQVIFNTLIYSSVP